MLDAHTTVNVFFFLILRVHWMVDGVRDKGVGYICSEGSAFLCKLRRGEGVRQATFELKS